MFAFGGAVPAGGHHGDGGEQAAVAGKIDRETGALVIVAVHAVDVLRRVEEQRVDGAVRFAQRAAVIATSG